MWIWQAFVIFRLILSIVLETSPSNRPPHRRPAGDDNRGKCMTLPSEGSVQSSFRVKWEKFTASKNKNCKTVRVAREMRSGSSCLKFQTLGRTQVLHLHTLNRLAQSCTYMTQTDDGALLPVCVAAPLLRKTRDSCRAPYHQFDSTPFCLRENTHKT